jgi:sugar transferase (PEP-CTERM/EpsH1 system associated)
MKILALWHDLPSPYTGSSLPLFNLLRYLAQKHNITLLSFREMTQESRYTHDLNQYCELIEPIGITVPTSLAKQILYTARNTLSPQNLLSKNPSLFNFYYSAKMQARIRDLLSTREFDLIYASGVMAHYVQAVHLPKVVHSYDCMTEMYRQKYLSMRNRVAELFWWLQYLRMKRYEGNTFRKFDACIVVSTREQKTVQTYFPDVNAVVVPNGVDSQFFTPVYEGEEWPALLFVGTMNYQPNVDAVLYFCSHIYERIKKDVSEARLYIVGRDPPKEVCRLSSDKSIIVTGYVEDVRPYLSRASVVVAPFVSGTTGIKAKVLEAMAMAKPVVSTSMGIQGIDVSPNENVLVAGEPEEFARQVIELLNNAQLRQRIGSNGRKLVVTTYSWEKTAERLEEVFKESRNKGREQVSR